ncbi:MAG TPA: type II secretion system minor pseudopilin GspK [Parvularculaceae bacterium]|nr:type II secretion system minor pseudopilin GspK [Parvularculaceae bacterium]
MSVGPDIGAQRGAALIIVLLLVATLAVISLAISESAMLSARRAVDTEMRSALEWRGIAAEAVAQRAIEIQMAAMKGRLSRASPLVAGPVTVPIEGGSVAVAIKDGTRCFNINSLVPPNDKSQPVDESASTELEELLAAAGIDVVDARAIIPVVVDWVDSDGFQEPGGAEDGVYTAMPTPYRTGSQPLADISELRAMLGVDRKTYNALRFVLCAEPSTAPSPININMLTEADAPLLMAVTGGKLSRDAAENIIAAIPPGGYDAVDKVLSDDKVGPLGGKEFTNDRLSVWSRYLEADATINYRGASLDLNLMFEVDQNGKARLLSRRLGRFE